ncbi:MAG: hypothetical protein ACYTFI_00955 [Planctomycetota bacterium]|jgi:hypothetical protein
MHTGREDKGAVRLLAMVFVSALAAFAASVLYEGHTKSRAVGLSGQTAQSRLLAESALEAARDSLDNAGTGEIGTAGWSDWNGDGQVDWNEVKDLGNGPAAFGGGHYWARVTTLADPQYKRITGYGRMGSGPAAWRDENGEVQRMVTRMEMIVKGTNQKTHPAFSGDYATFVGNSSGVPYELRIAGQVGGRADRIVGDVYVDGDVKSTAASQVDGDIRATGEISGKPPTGEMLSGPDQYIEPPNFDGIREKCDVNVNDDFKYHYDNNTDKRKIQTNIAGTESGNIKNGRVETLDAGEPAHIFARDSFTSSAMGDLDLDGENWQLGDWATNNVHLDTSVRPGTFSYVQDMKIYPNGNHKSYYVDGNLWIDPQGHGSKMILDGNPSADGAQITIIVEGNIYLGDEMYNGTGSGLDGIALIAIGQRYPEGHAKEGQKIPVSDPLYRREGSGNVFFGDLNRNVRPLEVNGMLFAENMFKDEVKSGGEPVEFTVNGLMAAGGQLDIIDRGKYKNYAPMTVVHDPRLSDGTISLPNLPTVAGDADDPAGAPWDEVMRWHVR